MAQTTTQKTTHSDAAPNRASYTKQRKDFLLLHTSPVKACVQIPVSCGTENREITGDVVACGCVWSGTLLVFTKRKYIAMQSNTHTHSHANIRVRTSEAHTQHLLSFIFCEKRKKNSLRSLQKTKKTKKPKKNDTK